MKKRKIDPLEEIMSNPYYQLRDDYNYAEKVKGTISFGQYSMKYWALERDIVLDGTKSEITEERFVKAIMDARKEGEILNDEDEVNGARKIRRKVISHLNIIFCGKAKCKSQIKIGINTQLTLKNIVFFNWILKINGKTLAKTIERIEGKKNELITKISESRGKTKTVEDYYRELLVRGLNSLKENEISPKLVEKRIKELYPDIKEEPKSEIEDSQKFEGWPIIWRLGDELFDMEMKYPHSEWVYQTIYQDILESLSRCHEEIEKCADKFYEAREVEHCMKRLVSTLNLPKEDWLRYRKCGITGTDAGAILGLNPYRSAFQVYHDKISDTIENIDNEAMRQGRDLEDYVAQRFSEETGFKVRRANAIYQSEEHPLLLADFDRLIVGQKAGLECKTVSPFSADKWADGKIPAHYLAQVDHYLAVSGFDCWYVAALIFGRELVIHKIVTDKQVLSDLIDEEERFWTNHVVPQIPPAPNGCECDTQQINQMYEVDNRDKTADLSALHGLLDKRQELSDQIEQMEQEKTAIEQQVKLQMQDAAYGTAPGYKVSWVSSESKRVDSQRLRKEQPDIFNQYSKNVSSRRFTIIHAA